MCVCWWGGGWIREQKKNSTLLGCAPDLTRVFWTGYLQTANCDFQLCHFRVFRRWNIVLVSKWGVYYRLRNLCFCFSVLSLTETVTTLPSLEWQRRLKSMSMVQSFRMQWIFTTLRMKWPVIPKSGRHWFVFELRVPFSLDCLCVAIVLLSCWELEGKGGMQELMEIGWHKHCYLCTLGSSKVVTKPTLSGGKKAIGK